MFNIIHAGLNESDGLTACRGPCAHGRSYMWTRNVSIKVSRGPAFLLPFNRI